MVHLMAYTLLHENLQSDAAPNLVIYYDAQNELFLVGSTKEGFGGYSVTRGELVGNLKYTSEVISEILSRIPENTDYIVELTNKACNSIALVCEANRLLY